jgi:diguanylate cyclase (GGDEF)-like protein
MLSKVKPRTDTDPADWVLIFVCWIIYLGGIFYFSRLYSSWEYIALGAVPVLISAWYLGMIVGAFSSLFSISTHLGLVILRGNSPQSLDSLLINHLVGFALLAITGMFVGHLRDLQKKSKLELLSLAENNKKISKLSQILEATNRLTTNLMSSQEWLNELPGSLKNIGAAADVDHLILMQLTGEGTENYFLRTHHYWAVDTSLTDGKPQQTIPNELLHWINDANPGIPEIGQLKDLSQDLCRAFSFGTRGEFVILPIFANTALWGFLGFENNQHNATWDAPEINTFKSVAQTLGSIIYKKLIEDHLNLRAKELDSLQKASTNLSSGVQLETNIHTILSQILELTPAKDASVFLLRNLEPEFYISLGNNQQQLLPFSHPGEKEISQLVGLTSQDQFISNIQSFADIPPGLATQNEAVISYALKAVSEVIGVLNIWYDKPREFNDEEKTILRLLADQAASAIVNVQFLQSEREQRILADSLRKANIQLSDNLDLKQVLESILEQVLTLVSARDSHIFLYNGEKLEFGAVKYADDVQHDPVKIPGKDSIFYQTAKFAEKILVPDIQSEKSLQSLWKTGSLISLPLVFQRTVIGIMNISFYEPGDFDDQLLQVLNLLSNQAAIAIKNARTYEAEREQRQLAQALQHTGRAIQSSLDLEVVLDQILTQIASVIPYNSANLIMIENGNAIVVRQQGYNLNNEEFLDQKPIDPFDVTRFITLEKMTETKQPIIIPNTDEDSDWIKTRTTEEVLSWAGAPILDGDKVIGFLSLNNHTRNFYQPEQAETLSAFASQAAIALVHARLHKEIQEMAVTDPLTGIFNRRGLDRWGQYEIDRAKRFASPLSAIFFDLDHFKEINDTYGHDAGDTVLQQVVSCTQGVIRKIDIFSRVGGEEFLIILPETSMPIAVEIAERLRNTVADCEIFINSEQIKLTISLGVVELSDSINDLQELINAADKYMYEAKQTGRNRSSFPQPELSSNDSN